jgi:beta-glucosidase
MHDVFLDAVAEDGSDFIGVQTYTRQRIGPDGALGPEPGAETTQMGYEFWPQALEACVREAARTRKPVIVTENGIGTADDSRRIAYIETALRGLHRAIQDGVDVRGYIHWSSMDNFEWTRGYGPTFGLIAVDRETLARRPKLSAYWYAGVIRRNGLP